MGPGNSSFSRGLGGKEGFGAAVMLGSLGKGVTKGEQGCLILFFPCREGSMISGLSMPLALIPHGGRVCTRKLETLELGKSTSEGQVKLLW